MSYAEVKKKNEFEDDMLVKLGNLPPNSDVQISITFSHQVDSLLNSYYSVNMPLIFVEDKDAVEQGKPILTLDLFCTGEITFC